jgi:RNA polymerase sigma-70 factor, ECF subfamily
LPGAAPTTRSSIIARAAKGDTRELARLYLPVAFAMARKLGLSKADAEDVTQQVVLELLELMPRFRYDRARGRFKGLIKKIVWSRTIDLRRASARVDLCEQLDDVGDVSVDFDALFEREWKKAQWNAALERVRRLVKPSTYQSFQLFVLQQRPIDEVAKTLGLTRNQVSQNKRRVMQHLRACIEESEREQAAV